MAEWLQAIGQTWQAQAALRLALAAALGALIGLEREHHGRSAGLRTQLLVALGSAVVMVVSLQFARLFGGGAALAGVQVDPARMAYGVMGGIGFIGAGAILHLGLDVRGVTTAASLWCSAAIGLACGVGLYSIAMTAAALVLFALVVLDRLERLIPSENIRRVSVTLPGVDGRAVGRCMQVIGNSQGRRPRYEYRADVRENVSVVTVRVAIRAENVEALLERLRAALPDLLALEVQ